MRLFQDRKLGKFPIFLKQTGEFIGTCGLEPFDLAGQAEVELGYRLCLKFWGKAMQGSSRCHPELWPRRFETGKNHGVRASPEQASTFSRSSGFVIYTIFSTRKSSTLAAIIDRANSERAIHILSIEDPIEFCHNHKKATIHQRELYSDTPRFALALRAALRQAPKVIFVGEMRDRETIEIPLEAAETGHLVLSTLHTIDASKTVERIVGVFPLSDQQSIRNRFSKAFRFVVSQRLLPCRDGKGRVAVLEILKSSELRTRSENVLAEGGG